MRHRRVAGHQIQQHMHVPLMGFFKYLYQVLIASIAGRYRKIILHVITRVAKRRLKTGIDPERVTAKLLNVIQFFDNALQIPDTVPVGIVEGLRVNFIENGIIQPARSSFHK